MDGSGDFDSHINFSHLLECLKTVLSLHQELEYGSANDPIVAQMVAVYLLLNLGSSHAIWWALTQVERRVPVVRRALRISRLYLERNFVGMFKDIRKLDLFPLLAIHWKMPQIYS